MYAWMCKCMCICVYVCVYACMCVCMYYGTCMYALHPYVFSLCVFYCTHTYTHTHKEHTSNARLPDSSEWDTCVYACIYSKQWMLLMCNYCFACAHAYTLGINAQICRHNDEHSYQPTDTSKHAHMSVCSVRMHETPVCSVWHIRVFTWHKINLTIIAPSTEHSNSTISCTRME